MSHRFDAAILVALAGALLAVPPAFCQQQEQYVGRVVLYSGFMYLDSPHVGLQEPGFHIQGGIRYSRHISLGFDYSRGTGDTTVGLGLATTALQAQINPLLEQLKGVVPPGYVPSLPLSSVTHTFAMGPDFPYRRFNRITPFIRPALGAIHEIATVHPADFLTQVLASSIVPSGKKEDWTYFYGFGGGIAFNVTKHFSLMIQADLLHDHLFNDLLKDGRNTLRISIGPAVQFGRNVTKK